MHRLIRTGIYLATRPTYSTIVVIYGETYYYAGGVYYARRGSRYIVVRAPRGGVVYSLPRTTTVVYVGEAPYYYYGGTYYVTTVEPAEAPEAEETADTNVNVNVTLTSQTTTENGETVELATLAEDDTEENYKVVAPPVGATVPYLPEEATEKAVSGKRYFVYEDTYYRPFASDGETIYMVVEDPT